MATRQPHPDRPGQQTDDEPENYADRGSPKLVPPLSTVLLFAFLVTVVWLCGTFVVTLWIGLD